MSCLASFYAGNKRLSISGRHTHIAGYESAPRFNLSLGEDVVYGVDCGFDLLGGDAERLIGEKLLFAVFNAIELELSFLQGDHIYVKELWLGRLYPFSIVIAVNREAVVWKTLFNF